MGLAKERRVVLQQPAVNEGDKNGGAPLGLDSLEGDDVVAVVVDDVEVDERDDGEGGEDDEGENEDEMGLFEAEDAPFLLHMPALHIHFAKAGDGGDEEEMGLGGGFGIAQDLGEGPQDLPDLPDLFPELELLLAFDSLPLPEK